VFDLSALNDSFNQSNQGLISGADDSRIKMWRLNTSKEKDPLIRTFDCSSEVRALTTTSSPFIFASGLSNGDINVWNITGGLIHSFLNG
jgi:WD40 repeat protein